MQKGKAKGSRGTLQDRQQAFHNSRKYCIREPEVLHFRNASTKQKFFEWLLIWNMKFSMKLSKLMSSDIFLFSYPVAVSACLCNIKPLNFSLSCCHHTVFSLGKSPGPVIVQFHGKVCSLQMKSLHKVMSGVDNMFVTAMSNSYNFSCCSEW